MSIWYDKGKLLSYNSILNFLIGQRGGGKTYGFKTWAIDDFIKNKNQFLWLRRYKSELEGTSKGMGVINTWFNDVAHLYPKHKLEIKGNLAYIDGEVAGYFGALSISEQWKSIPFKNVNKVIYDEFLIRTGVGKQYIKNEPVVFLELMETVGRMRDNVRYILIGNALTFSNPYFTYFGVKPFKSGIRTDRERGITVQLYNNDEFTKVKSETKFGKLVKGTDYGDYAIENEFLLDNDSFIAQRTPKSKNWVNVKWEDKIFGIWIDYDTGIFYASNTYDKQLKTYTFKAKDHDLNFFLIKSNSYVVRAMKTAFSYSTFFFEDQVVKTTMLELLNVL